MTTARPRPHPAACRPAHRRRHRGTVLIAMTLVVIVLAALVLVMARTTRVEALASANFADQAQADAAERAGEQYVVALLALQREGAMQLTDEYFQDIPVGDASGGAPAGGSFWVVRAPYVDLNSGSEYGLADEAAKVNLTGDLSNDQTRQRLLNLPGMTEDMIDAIADWQDTDEEVDGAGAEDQYYQTLPDPYRAKNSAIESLEELLLIRGLDKAVLYGDRGGPYLRVGGGSDLLLLQVGGEIAPPLEDGLFDAVTCYPEAPRSRRGRPAVPTSAAYSAVVVGLSADRRAFRCCRIVVTVDIQGNNPPRIVYRRDISEGGNPLRDVLANEATDVRRTM